MQKTKLSKERFEANAKNLKYQISIGLGICAILIVASGLIVVNSLNTYQLHDLQSLALFGEYISGSVGTILTLVSAILIYVAFAAQRLDSIQRQIEIDLSLNQIATQQFENLFISLLNFHHDGVKTSSADFEGSTKNGRSFFEAIYKLLCDEYAEVANVRSSSEEAAITAYEVINKKYRQQLGHYFRNLYNIVKFIDQSFIEDKQTYANLLRAQLSTYESLLLFYNCLHPKGRSKFYDLLAKYHLLESLPVDQLISNEHVRLYPWEAYGNRKITRTNS